MSTLNELSTRIVAAVSALTLSAIFMATAILPALPTVAASGMVA